MANRWCIHLVELFFFSSENESKKKRTGVTCVKIYNIKRHEKETIVVHTNSGKFPSNDARPRKIQLFYITYTKIGILFYLYVVQYAMHNAQCVVSC